MKTTIALVIFTASVSMFVGDAIAQRPGARPPGANGRQQNNQNGNDRQQFNQNENGRQQGNQNGNDTATMARNLLANFDADGSSSLDAGELQLALDALRRMMSQNRSQTDGVSSDNRTANGQRQFNGQRDATTNNSATLRRGNSTTTRSAQNGNRANRGASRQRSR